MNLPTKHPGMLFFNKNKIDKRLYKLSPFDFDATIFGYKL